MTYNEMITSTFAGYSDTNEPVDGYLAWLDTHENKYGVRRALINSRGEDGWLWSLAEDISSHVLKEAGLPWRATVGHEEENPELYAAAITWLTTHRAELITTIRQTVVEPNNTPYV